jgi:hypothetical protein
MRRRELLIASLPAMPLIATRGLATPDRPKAVVLELFTSQACSSCPPADAFLGELSRQPGVIALAWHVDYWNNLGWRDPYARREWTDRQQSYARNLREEVYTPALVVNGAAMVVGSDKAAVRGAIDAAASPPVAVTLRRTASALEAEIGSTGEAMTGTLVIYDPVQATLVNAGENQGRQLTEYRIVREVIEVGGVTARMTFPSVAAHRGTALLIRGLAGRVLGAADLLAT